MGGADISSENSPLLSGSGFMASLYIWIPLQFVIAVGFCQRGTFLSRLARFALGEDTVAGCSFVSFGDNIGLIAAHTSAF